MSNGSKVAPAIASGSASVQAGDVQFSVRVQRSAGGVWQMWNLFGASASNAFPASDPATVTNNPQQGTNNAIAVEGAGFVGFQTFINTSASSSRNLALDDLSVDGQIVGFDLRSGDVLAGIAGDATNTAFAAISNAANACLDRWQSVAFSCDGTNARLHVAGNLATNVPARFAAALQSQLLIGRGHGGTAPSHLRGAMDDLRIYTRALSDAEIADLYDRVGDADGDGRDNFQEYQAGTDPNNAASFPATISGTVAYSGGQTRFIWVVASPSSDGFPTNRSARIPAPGAFGLSDVSTLDHLWLKAFLDANGDGAIGPCEPRGSCLANPVCLTNAASGISIALSDDTNAPALIGVPAFAVAERGHVPPPPTVSAIDSFEGGVPVAFSQTTNDLPDFRLYAGGAAQGLNGYRLTGFENALVGAGSISHEPFSGFAVSPPNHIELATTLDGVTCSIQHRDDDGTLGGALRAFQVEDPVAQGGAAGAGAGLDENSGGAATRNMFVFAFDTPVGFAGLDALDLESSPQGTLATLRAYDAESNLLHSADIVYPNSEDGDGQLHFIGLTSDQPNIGILTVTVGDTSGSGNSQHLAFDNLRFGTAAAADFELIRTWTASDGCGNGVAATQRVAIVEVLPPPLPEGAEAEPELWINELHYDNAGADLGEGVEIAGRAGLPLDGYQLAFYGGANGKVYKTVPLSGALGDEGCGVGARWFPVPGIQNGPADGIALVQDRLATRQFLSYEGALTASNGPAAGLSSAPISVSEPVSTAAGCSLQLAGTLETDEDFAWTGPAPASPDRLNDGQIVPCGGTPSAPRYIPPSSMIHITGINELSNAMEVTLASTNNAGSFSADLFSCDAGGTNGNFRGFASPWSLAAANLVLVGTNPVTFADTGQLGRPPPAAAPLRIYAAARSDVDSDADGLSDGMELFVHHTLPSLADTDEDGLSDGEEVNDSGTSPRNRDSDGDELTDGEEVFVYGTDPLSSDTDGDGMTDGWEVANGFDPLEKGDPKADADGDHLLDVDEQQAGTDPHMADTDGDGIGDLTDPATGNCSLGGRVLNYTLPAHWEKCYNGGTGHEDLIATVEAHPTGFVGNVEAITNIVLSGWVDDCFKINDKKYVWTPGNKAFNENITDQVADKLTGHFSVALYDFISNVSYNCVMLTSNSSSTTVGASCLIQYRIALVVDLSMGQDWECWSSNGTYNAGAHLTTDSYTDGRVTWSLEAIAGSSASIGDNGVVTFGAGGGRYRIRASAVDLGTCYDSMTLVVPKVDIRQTETNVCQNCGCSVTLDVTDDSYSPGGYVWSSSPAGISGRGSSITFNPGTNPPGTYTVYAKSAAHPECLDTCTVNVINVDLRVDESDTNSCHLNTVDGVDQIATVKGSGYVVLKAVLEPDTPEIRNLLTWDVAAQQADKITAKVPRSAAIKQVVSAKINGNICREGNVWVVWAPIEQLITNDPPGKPDDSEVSPRYFPDVPDASTCEFGALTGTRNGILLQARIYPESFSNAHNAVRFRFIRTKEKNVWIKEVGSSWRQKDPGGSYSPPDTPDGPSDWSSDCIPSYYDNMYNADTPGFGFATSNAISDVEQIVHIGNYEQHVEILLPCMMNWTDCSSFTEWHSITWLEPNTNGFWRRTVGKNEIGAGLTTVGDTSSPPGQ